MAIIPSIFSNGQKYVEHRILGIVFYHLASKKLRKSTIKTYVLHTTEIIQSWFRDTRAPTMIENLKLGRIVDFKTGFIYWKRVYFKIG